MKRVLTTLSLLVLGLVTSVPAYAWHWVVPFAGPPWHGAGGNYYTGSPRSLGLTCSTCHVGAQNIPPAQRVQVQVTTRRISGGSLVADDIFTNGYQPGERYKVTVSLIGEHKGRHLTTNQYEDPNGSAHKVNCPLEVDNVNIMTAEVMAEDQVTYASVDGNAAGTLRGDTNNDPNSTQEETRCLVAVGGCGGGGTDYPTRTLQGGPTTVSYRNIRLTDPNSNPPFGSYTCTQCDAIASMYGADTTPDENGSFQGRQDHFFWTAPSSPPAAGNGRIRFYITFLDGDGYTDVYDDDIAEFRRAVCPAGNASCDPQNPPWNYTAVPFVPQSTPVEPSPPAAPPTFVLALFAVALALLAGIASQSRARRVAMAAAMVVGLAGTAALASGCVNVKAWERGRMATLVMSKGPDVEEAMIERTFLESREGASGGSAAAAGGGCACN